MQSDSEEIAPASSYFENPKKIKPNTVIIHFTDKPNEILTSGFRGVDITHIGLTTNYKTNPGPYVFGVDIADYSALDSAKSDYGRHAIVCKLKEGLKAYHNSDDYDQVIFDASDAYDLHSIKNTYDMTVEEIRQNAKKFW